MPRPYRPDIEDPELDRLAELADRARTERKDAALERAYEDAQHPEPTTEPPGTLKPGEPHPAARAALEYVATLPFWRLTALAESFSSCAIDGNRFAEVCAETLRRVMNREPVSDRYILGLAWSIHGVIHEPPQVKSAQEAPPAPDQG